MGYRGAERFADEAFDAVHTDGYILADTTTAPPLLYVQQVKNKYQSVKIISNMGNSIGASEYNKSDLLEAAAEGLVYVVSPIRGYCPVYVLDSYKFEKVGVLYHAVSKNTE